MLSEIKLSVNKYKSLNYLVSALKKKHKDLLAPKFCMFLGAGASASAGIPTGGMLIEYLQKRCFINDNAPDHSENDIRYENIDKYLLDRNLSEDLKAYVKHKQEDSFNEKTDVEKEYWIKSIPNRLKSKDINADKYWDAVKRDFYHSTYYGRWFDEFSESPRDRQELIEEIIDGKEPSAGYILLSLLVEKDIVRHFFTTNFDDLVHDAIFTECGKKSRVFAHDETAHFINFKSNRSNIIKLHGDYLYQDMRNTLEETATLTDKQSRKLREAANDFGLIIIGYSGADESIMSSLEAIKEERGSNFPIIWCGRNEDSLNWRAKSFIEHSSNTFFVEIDSFDDLMIKLLDLCSCNIKTIKERTDKITAYDEKIRLLLLNRNKDRHDKNLGIQIEINEIASQVFSDNAEMSFEDRINILDHALKRYSNHPSLHALKGQLFNDNGQHEEAINELDIAIKELPDTRQLHLLRGSIKFKEKDYQGSIEDLDSAIKITPSAYDLYSLRASCKSHMKDYAGALRDANTAIAGGYQSANPYNTIAMINKHLKNYSTALEVAERAKAIDPSNGWIHSTIAEIYSDLGEEEKFFENLRVALELKFTIMKYMDEEPYISYKNNPKFIKMLNDFGYTEL